MARTWSREFPGFPEIGVDPVSLGFVHDASWHNDLCPSFETADHRQRLWVDHPDPVQRESGCARYMICSQDDDGCSRELLFSTDSADELRAFLKKSGPVPLKKVSPRFGTIIPSLSNFDF